MDYNPGFADNPAPLVKIKLSNPWKPDHTLDWVGLLDTGSDMSIIPKSYELTLGLHPYTTVDVETAVSEEDKKGGKDQKKSERPVALINVEFLDFPISFNQISVILSEVDVMIIGRDILNTLNVTFSGPELKFDIN